MTGAGEETGTCRRPGCSSAAFRAQDELSYAREHFIWICLAGHVVHEEGPTARSVA